MAHELTQRADGTTEMAYVGDTPWHGLGQTLKPGAKIEEWLTAAGMDWTIRRAPVHYHADRAATDMRKWDDKQVLLRSDTGAPLGIVSPDYNIVQPYEVLEFFRNLVDGQGFQLETAGTMFGGRRYWALAKMTEALIAGWDRIGGYMLLTTSADGSFASEARETSVRVVCNNTLSMAVAQNPGKHYVKINHRQSFNIAAVQKQMCLGVEHFAAFTELANLLSKAKVSNAAAEEFTMNLLRPASADAMDEEAGLEQQEETTSRKPRGFDMIMGLFDGAGRGADKKGSKGTAWGLVNAVTEYVDHLATAQSVDHRLARAWWGAGDDLKIAAMDQALEQFV